MVREDIIAALNNALERGQSLQDSMLTLIYAGYDSNEVREASKYVHLGNSLEINNIPLQQPFKQEKREDSVLTALQGPSKDINPIDSYPQSSNPQPLKQFQPLPSVQPIQAQEIAKKHKFLKIILIILIFFLLVLIGGLIFFSFFGETFLDSVLK